MTRIPRMPGRWLAQLARLFFSDDVLRSVVYPAVADFQHEALTAESPRDRLLARLRGYWAFWKLVGMAPFAFGHAAPVEQPARGFWPVTVLVLTVLVLFVGWRPWMNQQFGRVFKLLPEGSMTTVGQFSARRVSGGAAGDRGDPRCRSRPLPCTAARSHTARAAVSECGGGPEHRCGSWCIRDDRQAGICRHRRGRGRHDVERHAADNCDRGLHGVHGTAMAGIRFARRRRESPAALTASGPMPMAMALGLSVLLVASVLSIDQFLRAHREFTEGIVLITTPRQPGSCCVGQQAAQQFEVALTLLSWGVFLTVMLPVAGFTTWRASRSRAAHPLFKWVARVAVIVAVGTSTMHLRAIQSDLDSFNHMLKVMKPANSRQPPLRR